MVIDSIKCFLKLSRAFYVVEVINRTYAKLIPARRPDEDSTTCTARQGNKTGQFCVSPNKVFVQLKGWNAKGVKLLYPK
jgi:hypothetical protein